MTLVEQLLKADTKKVTDRVTGTYESKMLARALGKPGTVPITIREISARRLNEIMDGALDDNGQVDLAKAYDANIKVCVAGVIDPDLKNKELQEHYGAKLAIDLAETLFKGEVSDIAQAISQLAQVENPLNDEETIKN